MRHTLNFNFVFERGHSKEDYLNRILSFLKGFEAETIFNKIYHSELKDEVYLMDKVPQNSIKHEINLNDENDFNKSVLKAVQYMEYYVNHISGNLPFVITFKKSFQRKKQQIFYHYDIHQRIEINMDSESIKKELEMKIKQLYSNKQKMIELAPVVQNAFDSYDLYLGDVNYEKLKQTKQFDLGFHLFDEMLEDVFEEVNSLVMNPENILFEFILHCELQPKPFFSQFKNEPEEELPF